MNRTVAVSFFGSVFFHAAAFSAYFYLTVFAPKNKLTVISNVDLIVQEKVRQIQVIKKPQVNTWNFLKLAMPQIVQPKLADKLLDVKTREQLKEIKLPEKLQERSGKIMEANKIDMDAGRRVISEIKDMSAAIKFERSNAALAPKIELEEVGVKQAPVIPADIKFDEQAAPVRPQSIQEVSSAIMEAKRASNAAPMLLQEAQASKPAWTDKLAAQLPGRPQEAGQQEVEGIAAQKRDIAPVLDAGRLSRAIALKEAETENKKVEIEGPLSGRKVVKSYIPEFPSWAKEKGILEASVAIRFYVDSYGRVMDSMKIEITSGYGALDRLSIDALKKWVFAPLLDSTQKQWGVITFRFVMD